METELSEQIRLEASLQSVFNNYRVLLEARAKNVTVFYQKSAQILLTAFENEATVIIEYINNKLMWPLAFKRNLLRTIRAELEENDDGLDKITDFVLHPSKKIKHDIRKPINSFRFPILNVASIERKFGSAVSSLLQLQHKLFLMNFFSLIIWISAIVIPYKALTGSTSIPNASFDLSSIFTTEGYLAESIMFQSSYQNIILRDRYNLPLIYLITSYCYFFFWFIFLTIQFAASYKKKVLKSILNENLDNGFMCTFAKYDYTIESEQAQKKHQKIIYRQFCDFVEICKQKKLANLKNFKTNTYKIKLLVTNLFYIVLALASGLANWAILESCDSTDKICVGSIIFLALMNRLIPYAVVVMTQVEQYKYQSYKLDTVGFRLFLINICTILSFMIHFFVNRSGCYEKTYVQFIYLFLLADLIASLILPFMLGAIFDLLTNNDAREFDGINMHVQLTPSVLLYSQFLIWISIYFAPLISIMILFNLLFSYLSHRIYIRLRSKQADSIGRVFIWNAHRLEYVFYSFAYISIIIGVTSFIVFTTVISPSGVCGPFQSFNYSYQVIDESLSQFRTSVLLVSIIDYLSSPGFIYFIVMLFIVLTYKFKQEKLAEKQLVFIRQNNVNNKKNLHKQVTKNRTGQRQ